MSSGSVLCPRCRAEVHPAWPFCSHCGSPLDRGPPPAVQCENCGADVEANGTNCWKCGVSIVREDDAPSPQRSVVPPGVAGSGSIPGSVDQGQVIRPAAAAYLGSPQTPVCGNCGAAVDTTGAFCWKCGVPLRTGREPFLPEPPVETEPSAVRSDTLSTYGASSRANLGRPSSFGQPRSRPSRRSILGGVLILGGVGLLVLTLLVGWYGVTDTVSDTILGTSFSLTGSETFYPLNQVTVSVTCAGTVYCPQSSSVTGPYSQSGLNSLGTLYTAVAIIVILGVILGIVGAGLAFAGRRHQSGVVGALIVTVLLLTVLAPTVLVLEQPNVLASESNGSGNSSAGPSPRSSFFGSCTGTGCGGSILTGSTESASWGPSIGWYLCFVAIIPIFSGLLLARSGSLTARRNRPPGPGDLQTG
jgi:double zinc ribbon protein